MSYNSGNISGCFISSLFFIKYTKGVIKHDELSLITPLVFLMSVYINNDFQKYYNEKNFIKGFINGIGVSTLLMVPTFYVLK